MGLWLVEVMLNASNEDAWLLEYVGTYDGMPT